MAGLRPADLVSSLEYLLKFWLEVVASAEVVKIYVSLVLFAAPSSRIDLSLQANEWRCKAQWSDSKTARNYYYFLPTSTKPRAWKLSKNNGRDDFLFGVHYY